MPPEPDLDNEEEEYRFVATGPNEGLTVRGLTGFYTSALKLAYGVNVSVSKCGVYGEAVNEADSVRNPVELDHSRAGVWGIGNDYGVFGRGFTTAGVYGESTSGVGVYGLASNPGLAGISKGSKGTAPNGDPKKLTESYIGVIGATETGKGFGVVGLSADSVADDPINPASVPTATVDEKGQLVFDKLGFGTGVLGASSYGTGVRGHSETGVGVQGNSGGAAGVVGESIYGTGECSHQTNAHR